MSLEKHIDFNQLTPDQFEELSFELLIKHGFTSITWRQGGADNGRDIEADFSFSNGVLGTFNEKFFFECKRYEKGVPPSELNSKIAWADAEKPQHIVFFISSYLTNNAREWLEKVKRDRFYKIHVIERKTLSRLLAQHDDLISKYFIRNKFINLLDETISKWTLHNLTPNFWTYYYLLDNLDKESLTTNQLVYLYVLYFTNYSKLEELENEIYHGIDISDHINELSEILKKKHSCDHSVLIDEFDFDTLSDEGYLKADEESNLKFKYDFIACEASTKKPDGKSYKLCYYLFRRLSENESIEIILHHTSSLDFKIRYSNTYKLQQFREALNLVNLRQPFQDEVLVLSSKMQ
ncbi:restriction endonuclease [Flavobacterium collinsii]|uniref:Restriction endonuclease type IV Mrr domain-containing protein n=1 Tax=Flavobacterium collinsii TaxID=1114861 RepID=A0ABM8KMA1_9FLAO|nr:restriction endonuclease [Flavobacterium collinsii]CAA9200983.1 hypothetical protein FLACOL7796_03549 [Flavobacterium collinsii]